MILTKELRMEHNQEWIEENGLRGRVTAIGTRNDFIYEVVAEHGVIGAKELTGNVVISREQGSNTIEVRKETFDGSELQEHPSPDAILKFIFKVAKDLLVGDTKNPD